MAGLARGVAAAILLLSMTTFGFAANKVIIILDASGSMWAQIDGKPKLEIARESLRTVLQSVPTDDEIGFMAYGHREKGSCDDIQLIVPPQAGSGSAISAAADSLKFLGKTPLTAAVKQAAEALRYTEDKATVVLITDGLETCGGDPCALGKELEASGVDFTADVVGFGLTADEGKQIACLADNTGGKYIQASDEKALQEALAETVAAPAPAPEPAPAPAPAPAPEPAKPDFNFLPIAVLAEGGDPVTDGNAWEIYKAKPDGTRGDYVSTEYGAYKANLEPGDYIVVASDGQAKTEQKVKIEAGQVYAPLFNLNAGTLIIHPRPSEGADVVDGAAIVIDYPGADMPATFYGTTKAVLPAGDEKVTVTIGQGVATETIPLAAGKTVEKDMIVGVGHVVANAYYAAGGDKADGSGIGFKVLKAKKKIDGTRDEVTYAYGPDSKFDLPADDYVLIATVDLAVVEQPFTVKVGEFQDLKIAMNAGVLAITAPGASKIEIFEAKKDINGNRKSLGYAFDQKYQAAIPAGDYAVVSEKSDNSSKEGNVTVKAGERAELTVQ
ncbi:VWA domain-containing protein [Mesorhizobium sp. M7A.F.Ca.CA.001.09.2.1]|uniref:VWA domain-containing protein n=2 Tax=Mesorhizobium TaxID=68287 RepID=A0AB38TB66_9HYPH|nr:MULTISPECIES: VWA domain-containing protein [Mesorhizobium]RUY59362.1 VWA domain-containing protein [Mesorhizobium sp. M7A.F.Ca.CA.001.13.2.1]MDF3216972.1 VWA domain-containing protein [Mesorhizobium ciceri]RUY67461.1 VWA domain-containing protein [Mesorhizobium sp. M7A.F.Ca.CA.001.13.1.1]RUY69892.1 VWA domain-containing protein [Mesorhizobium sp. M7A.F.Ca.CA.001.05.1.1]RUY78704.1 VWA domain-containing protein [Mesorhizobium sp. M7A.F.Ca.CA.001.09.2.1]